jgi:hypothetical protein
MMNRKSLLLPALAAASLLALTLPNASAVQYTYTIGSGLVYGNHADPGLVLSYQLSSSLAGTKFSLNDGQSTTFDFFKIWTNETSVNPDDKQQKPISASLNFTDPFSSASLGGITFGGSTWYGVESGKLVWTTGPATVTAGGLTYSVALSDVAFNTGFLDLREGARYGAMVKATVTQIGSGYTSVPDNGSTTMLLGLAFLAIAFVRRGIVTV